MTQGRQYNQMESLCLMVIGLNRPNNENFTRIEAPTMMFHCYSSGYCGGVLIKLSIECFTDIKT